MTSQQALNIVNESMVRGEVIPEAYEYPFWETVRNALEKQIEKKPIASLDNGTGSECVCGETLLTNWKPKYCMFCGQAIKWRNE